MYEIALSVRACLRAGTAVSVVWIVDGEGLDPGERTDAIALTPGGGRVGSLLSGVLDSQLAELHHSLSAPRLVDLPVSEVDAAIAGLPSTGRVRCLLAPAEALPGELWDHLVTREPVCLVTRLVGTQIGTTTLYTTETLDEAPEEARRLVARGVSDVAIGAQAIVTALVPVPRLVIVGAGPVAGAVTAAAELLGWHVRTIGDDAEATAEIGRLAATDKVLVTGHDLELVGSALLAALSTDVGYIGALGGRRLQQERAEWLSARGCTDLERVHSPAGLDIGARTPGEIAVSILAEAVAVGAGRTSTPRPTLNTDAHQGPRGG